jgi:hypothetical protein
MESKLIPMLVAMHHRNFPDQRAGDVIMTPLAAVIVDEIDEIEQRDRKICISLDRKVSDANRELAQWLIDHPRYSQRVIASWLGCKHTRIFYLRKWATNGFQGMPFGKGNKRDDRPPNHRNSNGAARHQSPLTSQTNFQDDAFDFDGVEYPAIVLENFLDFNQER